MKMSLNDARDAASCIDVDPDPELLLRVAHTLFEHGEHEQALRLYQKMLENVQDPFSQAPQFRHPSNPISASHGQCTQRSTTLRHLREGCKH